MPAGRSPRGAAPHRPHRPHGRLLLLLLLLPPRTPRAGAAARSSPLAPRRSFPAARSPPLAPRRSLPAAAARAKPGGAQLAELAPRHARGPPGGLTSPRCSPAAQKGEGRWIAPAALVARGRERQQEEGGAQGSSRLAQPLPAQSLRHRWRLRPRRALG